MPGVVALIPVDFRRGLLGLPSAVLAPLAGKPVLRHVLERVAAVALVEEIVLVTGGEDSGFDAAILEGLAKPASVFGSKGCRREEDVHFTRAARAWALSAWRGGLGGATCYDELLPAGPLAAAMVRHGAESALLVGPDWPLVDTALCQRVLALHRQNIEAMQLTFTQAPPGLCGVAVSRGLLERLAQHKADIGRMLAYNPGHAQADPIGRDVCVQIAPAVRSCGQRFIYDTPRARAAIDALATEPSLRLAQADATEIVTSFTTLRQRGSITAPPLPQQITLELTPRRAVNGLIVPQHHIDLLRPDMPLDLALRLIGQLGAVPDVALTLGGLGDAMLHPQWEEIVTAARKAGVLAIAIETDLLGSRAQVARLLEAHVDVITVRMNADTAAVYGKVMGSDEFATLIASLEWLLNTRNAAGRRLPWIVPRLVKTPDTLPDMETFFDRWTHFTGQAVIEPTTPGRGLDNASVTASGDDPYAGSRTSGRDLMPALSPWHMASPRRGTCRQLGQRMSILSDGTVALCDQDWLGQGKLGDASVEPLAAIWQRVARPATLHAQGDWHQLPLCVGCGQWHRP